MPFKAQAWPLLDPRVLLSECEGGSAPSMDFQDCAPEFVKHAIPDYSVRGTGLFSLALSNKKHDNSQHQN